VSPTSVLFCARQASSGDGCEQGTHRWGELTGCGPGYVQLCISTVTSVARCAQQAVERAVILRWVCCSHVVLLFVVAERTVSIESAEATGYRP
jgi:hypothetical protein